MATRTADGSGATPTALPADGQNAAAAIENAPAAIERSDVCAVPAASVIVENVVAFEVACALVDKFGGDSLLAVFGSPLNPMVDHAQRAIHLRPICTFCG